MISRMNWKYIIDKCNFIITSILFEIWLKWNSWIYWQAFIANYSFFPFLMYLYVRIFNYEVAI